MSFILRGFGILVPAMFAVSSVVVAILAKILNYTDFVVSQMSLFFAFSFALAGVMADWFGRKINYDIIETKNESGSVVRTKLPHNNHALFNIAVQNWSWIYYFLSMLLLFEALV